MNGFADDITRSDRAFDLAEQWSGQMRLMLRSFGRQTERMVAAHEKRSQEINAAARDAWRSIEAARDDWPSLGADYWRDAWERWILTLDTLRERGNNDRAHEEAGTPPVLVYETETVMDGRDLKRPVNYLLLRIVPPQGVEVLDWKRPYMIVDPRAGHGAGIGGFKEDSQVGVALKDGHPVYFVAFRPQPEPGQTLADVTRAEAEFVREIARRHPQSPKPVIVGNCQGGWATMLLAAAHPDVTGPLIINGAPLAYWSGRVGENPMRYNGGLLGGVLPALALADLGHGVFDGAHLVANFEQLNPSRNYIGKYYDLYADVDRGRDRFLEFERWWGGFHFMTDAEIRWIVEQLFVGNRLARGEARIERGRHLDLKAIRSPIIVFASHGDNITPPQQALNWIVDTYADEHEIRIRGQRIIYMLHDKVGHLGIFVSSGVAKKEHTEMASTLKTIEALAPGLYEMVIEDMSGEGAAMSFTVSFQERRLADIIALDDGARGEEVAFAAVDRLSQLAAECYDLFWRPLVRSMVTPQLAKAIRDTHPLRLQRLAFSDSNPAMRAIETAAEGVLGTRKPVDDSNPFRRAEKVAMDSLLDAMDAVRDMRDAAYELTFFGIFGSPAMQAVGRAHNYQRTRKDPAELRFLPEVQAILLNVDRGGFAEAVIRMLIYIADARGSVRRSRLERSSRVLTQDEPFASLGPARRAALIHEQAVIVEFEKEKGIEALPRLLPTAKERQRAIDVVDYIAGPIEEMEPKLIAALQTLRQVLRLPRLTAGAESDPLEIDARKPDPAAA